MKELISNLNNIVQENSNNTVQDSKSCR